MSETQLYLIKGGYSYQFPIFRMIADVIRHYLCWTKTGCDMPASKHPIAWDMQASLKRGVLMISDLFEDMLSSMRHPKLSSTFPTIQCSWISPINILELPWKISSIGCNTHESWLHNSKVKLTLSRNSIPN